VPGARAEGVNADGIGAVGGRTTHTAFLALVADASADRVPAARPASRAAIAAIQLIKISHGLPAVLAADVAGHAAACDENIIRVEADTVARFADDAIGSLIVASEASVPLASGTSTRFVVFRDPSAAARSPSSSGSLTSGPPFRCGCIPPA